MILSVVFGFIVGIWIGSFGFAGWAGILSLLCIGTLVYGYSFFIEQEYKRVFVFVCVCFVGLIIGMVRMHFSDAYRDSDLIQFVGRQTRFEGVVVSEPDVREKSTMLTVLLQNANIASSTVTLSEKIILSAPLYPEFSYGDEISFTASLEEPDTIESNGRSFDYGGYLRVRGIWYTAGFVRPKLVSHDHGNPIKKYLYQVKNMFTGAIDNALPHPESSLMAGLLLGTKQSLGKELLGEFGRAGVSHVVVLSGYNIAIVAESIMAFLAFLPNAISFSLGCLGIVLFTILSGAGASAVRAAIMVLVALFAKKTNRNYVAGRALGFTIVLMLAPNPLLLAFDPSFQLSILATIGIVFVSPIITPYCMRVTERFGLREIISSTIATQLTVLPFLVYNTGLLSLVSLLINVLILGTIPLTMLLGFLVGLTGLVSLYLSFVPALFAYILLWYQLTIVHLGATLTFGAITLPAFSPWIVIFLYLSIGLSLYFLHKKRL